MAKIKISTKKKNEPEQEPEAQADTFADELEEYEAEDDPEPEPEPEPDEDVEELAKGMAKDVAEGVSPKPLTRPKVERADPDEDLNIDPATNYPKIVMLRVTVDDDQSMDDWIDKVKDTLKDVTKNATVLTKHRIVNGKQVSEHRYQEEL